MNPLALLGYPLVVLAVLHLAFGMLLGSRNLTDMPLQRYAMRLAFICAAYCLVAGLTYIRASLGLSYDIYYRAIWIGWFGVVPAAQMAYCLGNEGREAPRSVGIVLTAIWSLVYGLCLTTDLIEIGPVSLSPFVDRGGPLEQPLRMFGAALLGVVLLQLLQARRQTSGIRRQKTDYLLLGLASFGAGGLVLSGVVPVLGGQADPALTTYLSLPWILATFYAVTRHRLFDIRIALARAATGLTLTALFCVFHIGLFQLILPYAGSGAAITIATLVSAMILFMSPTVQLVRDLAISLLVRNQNDYQGVLKESAHTLASILNAEDLARALVDITRTRLQVRHAQLLLIQEPSRPVRPVCAGDAEPPLARLATDSALRRWLQRHRQVFIREEQLLDGGDGRAAHGEMAAANAELAIPLLYKDDLVAVLLLGEKMDRSAFLQQDIDLLETLASQGAVALENARLFAEAITDGLTGLYHQKYIKARLHAEIERSRRHRRGLVFMLLDIDLFKQINDTHGHLVGDGVLRHVAQVLRSGLREEDVAARYGGEEFAVLLIDADPTYALEVAERLRARVAAAHYAHDLRITVSVGVAICHPNETSGDELTVIQRADNALYRAKRLGRNRVELEAPTDRIRLARGSSDLAASPPPN